MSRFNFPLALFGLVIAACSLVFLMPLMGQVPGRADYYLIIGMMGLYVLAAGLPMGVLPYLYFVDDIASSTPSSEIDSASMGHVEFEGEIKPANKNELTTPLSGAECVYYCLEVHGLQGPTGRSSEPVLIADGSGGQALISEPDLLDQLAEEGGETFSVKFDRGSNLTDEWRQSLRDCLGDDYDDAIPSKDSAASVKITTHYLQGGEAFSVLGRAESTDYDGVDFELKQSDERTTVLENTDQSDNNDDPLTFGGFVGNILFWSGVNYYLIYWSITGSRGTVLWAGTVCYLVSAILLVAFMAVLTADSYNFTSEAGDGTD